MQPALRVTSFVTICSGCEAILVGRWDRDNGARMDYSWQTLDTRGAVEAELRSDRPAGRKVQGLSQMSAGPGFWHPIQLPLRRNPPVRRSIPPMSKPRPIRADWGSISGTGGAHATPGKAAKTKVNPATVQMLRTATERQASRVFWFIEVLLF